MSNDVQKIVINPYLGYDWNRKAILKTIRIQINHHIHNQFFFKIIPRIDINTWIISIHNDMKSHTG